MRSSQHFKIQVLCRIIDLPYLNDTNMIRSVELQHEQQRSSRQNHKQDVLFVYKNAGPLC